MILEHPQPFITGGGDPQALYVRLLENLGQVSTKAGKKAMSILGTLLNDEPGGCKDRLDSRSDVCATARAVQA